MTDEQLRELVRDVVAEQLLAQSGMPSYSALNGLTVAADGSISYDFDGNVKARGLQLDAGTNPAPPDERKVRWLREDNLALVAELSSYSGGGGATNILQLIGQAIAGGGGEVITAMRDAGGANRVGLFCDYFSEVTGDPANDAVVVGISGAGGGATLLDGNGASSFVKVPAPMNTRELWGLVNANGSTLDAGSGGWSITKGAAGLYTIVFDDAFAAPPGVTYNAITGGLRMHAMGAPVTGSVVIAILTTAGAGIDTQFSFRAIGAA